MTQQAADPTDIAFDLIAQSAPERQKQLEALWKKYEVRFDEVPAQAKIILNANKDRVQYARKDLQVMWLLGFSLWKSIELLAPAVLIPTLTGTPLTSVLIMDKKLDEIERNYRERMSSITALIGADDIDSAVLAARHPPTVHYPRRVIKSARQSRIRPCHDGNCCPFPP